MCVILGKTWHCSQLLSRSMAVNGGNAVLGSREVWKQALNSCWFSCKRESLEVERELPCSLFLLFHVSIFVYILVCGTFVYFPTYFNKLRTPFMQSIHRTEEINTRECIGDNKYVAVVVVLSIVQEWINIIYSLLIYDIINIHYRIIEN